MYIMYINYIWVDQILNFDENTDHAIYRLLNSEI